MEKSPKNLPYGISDYKIIVEDGLYYVDKTEYIEKLEKLHSYYVFFLRPRRFGKSLFTSVLENYYDIKEKDNFDKLFGNTYIGKHPTKNRNSYYVLKFNFSGLTTDTPELLIESFTSIIKTSLDIFLEKYGINIHYQRDGSPANIFDNFIGKIMFKIDKPIYVIIDEYDHFANELLSFRFDLFKESVSKTGFVRKWYEMLKKATETKVRRIFATGVSPITLDSMTSGFNIASDITMEKDFNEMMGFTDEEVKSIVRETAKFPISEKDINKLMDVLTENYDGYLFSEDAQTRLLNSDMILYYLKTYLDSGSGPKRLLDKNIASDYGKLGRIFEMTNKNRNMKILDSILKGEQISAQMTENFNMEIDFTTNDFISLLFYMGLLTIDKVEGGMPEFKVPNYVIKGLYFEYFLKKLEENINCSIDTLDLQYAIKDIAVNGSNKKFVKIIEDILSALSKRDFIKFDEKYIKLIMYGYLITSNVYNVKSEYEVESGYIDIALLKNNIHDVDHYAIFEVKYIKKSDYEKAGQALVKSKKQESITQLGKYTQSAELMSLPGLKKWALVFAGEKCIVNEEI
jgi:Holliday junction resolvase-like predicted endonuclease